MTESFLEQFVRKSPKNMRRFQQEQAISEVTGLIEQVAENQGVSRAKLARLLGKSKGFVTQLLDEGANKTVRTVADVFSVLGHELHFSVRPIQIGGIRYETIAEDTETGGQAKLFDLSVSVYQPSATVQPLIELFRGNLPIPQASQMVFSR